MKNFYQLISFLAVLGTVPAVANPVLPNGFSLTTFANVDGARSLSPVADLGVVFVGSRGRSLYAVIDQNHDGVAEDVRLLRDDLKVPNGVAWKDGYLYVAEQHRLIRFYVGDALPDIWPSEEILYEGFPDDRWHGWRYAAFGPDGALYVTIGVPCNICMTNGHEGTILKFDPDSWQPQVFATGIRNSVGLAFHPTTGALYFTDNGADNMGDDLPPDELNRADKSGLNFGYPFYGGGLARTDLSAHMMVPKNSLPIHQFQAHVAPLGLHFYQDESFPEKYHGGLFVAQHGSWNRSEPVGYKISFFPINKKGDVGKEDDFITGWLKPDGDILARPVDIKPWTDGRLLISDDYGDQIYLLDYRLRE
jgi:glucose/arabinose dehydrogenase